MHIEDNPRQLEYIGIRFFFLTGSFRFHFGVNVLANSNTFTYIYNGRPPAPNSIPTQISPATGTCRARPTPWMQCPRQKPPEHYALLVLPPGYTATAASDVCVCV